MLGKPVPDFSLPSAGGSTFRSTKERGRKLALYFYPKNMYGRKVRGIGRSTFVVDGTRRVVRAWRGVRVPGHVQEVLNFVKAL